MRFNRSLIGRSLRRFKSSRFALKEASKKSMLLVLFVLAYLLYSFILTKFENADIQKCESIYMYPSYAKLNGINSYKETRFADKYHLYLYREQGLDKDPLDSDNIVQIDGIPVLFIPGNAGSYKQGRSIAAQLSNYYNQKDFFDFEQLNSEYEFMQYEISNTTILEERSLYDFFFSSDDSRSRYRNIDFFTLDFNEDFTAFHGQTLLDQAEFVNDCIEYILGLYKQNPLLKDNEEYGPLPESVIIVAHSMGGIVSRTIPILNNYIPNSINTVITLSSPHGTSPLTFDGELLKIYKMINDFWIKEMNDINSYFYKNVSVISITGGIVDDVLPSDYTLIEPVLNSESPLNNGFTVYTSGIENVWTTIDHLAVVWCDQLRKIVSKSILSVIDKSSPSKTIDLKNRMNFFKRIYLDNSHFENHILNNNMTEHYPIDRDIENFTSSVKFNGDSILPETFVEKGTYSINLRTFKQYDDSNIDIKIDEKTMDQADVYLCNFEKECFLVNSLFKRIPVYNSKEGAYFKNFELENLSLQNYESLNIKIKVNDKTSKVFINRFQSHIFMELSFLKLLFGQNLEIKPNNDLQKITILSKLTSSLALKLSIKKQDKDLSLGSYIKQSLNQPYENKWYPLQFLKTNHISLTAANNPAFIPVKVDNDDGYTSFDLKVDNSDHVIQSITMSIDFGLTFKLLIKTYRLAFASIPVGFAAILFVYQTRQFLETGEYPPMNKTFNSLMNYTVYYGIPICLIIELFSFVPGIRYLLESWLDCIKVNDNLFNNAYTSKQKNEFFGNIGIGLDVLFIDYIILLLSLAVVLLLVKLINGIEFLVNYFKSPTKTNYKSLNEKSQTAVHNKIQVFKKLLTVGRIIRLILLVICVFMYVPYNLVYVVLVISHLLYTLKMIFTEKSGSPRLEFNKSVLLMMLLIVPICVPIVVVFFHNFAVNWKTPFRSHHNFLAVLPIMCLEFAMQSGLMIRPEKSIFSRAAMVTLYYMIFFSFIFGVRNTYFLYHIFNLLSCSLIMMLL